MHFSHIASQIINTSHQPYLDLSFQDRSITPLNLKTLTVNFSIPALTYFSDLANTYQIKRYSLTSVFVQIVQILRIWYKTYNRTFYFFIFRISKVIFSCERNFYAHFFQLSPNKKYKSHSPFHYYSWVMKCQ